MSSAPIPRRTSPPIWAATDRTEQTPPCCGTGGFVLFRVVDEQPVGIISYTPRSRCAGTPDRTGGGRSEFCPLQGFAVQNTCTDEVRPTFGGARNGISVCVVVDEAARQDNIPFLPRQPRQGKRHGSPAAAGAEDGGLRSLAVPLQQGTDAGDVHPVAGLEV